MMSRGAGCRHTDQHFCVWGPRVACVHTLTPQFLPCSGWAALLLVWSLVPSCPHGRRCPGQRGVGRRTSLRSTKAGGILELLGQHFSDIAKLRLGRSRPTPLRS